MTRANRGRTLFGVQIDNHLSVTSLVVGVCGILSIGGVWANTQSEIADLKQSDGRIESRMVEDRQETKLQYQQIMNRLDKIADKLDGKQDKR